MKSVGLLLLMILASGIGAAHWAPPEAPGQAPTLEWVRTADGWTRADALFPADRRPPPLHPLVVAGFQALASTLSLMLTPHRRLWRSRAIA